jgi:uncharacterized protein YjaZ
MLAAACGARGVTVEYRGGHAWSEVERTAIESISQRAFRDVRRLLPELPSEMRLTVQAGDNVIPETGETAEVALPAAVYWTVDPNHSGGVVGVVNAQLRATLFHELYHVAREARITGYSPVDRVIGEGLATAFERDFGGASAPWSQYPRDAADWAREFLALRTDSDRAQWITNSPDGRRWFGYKVGTYLADRASEKSGHSLAQLAAVPTVDILRWAQP